MRVIDKPLYLLKHLIRVLTCGLVGGFLVLIAVFISYLDNRPDLHLWHKEILEEEYTADAPIRDLEGYLALEERLFTELDTKIYDRIKPKDRKLINRYHSGSLSDPSRWPTNWNRTFELKARTSHSGVLLLHGMSDSPYSLRVLGQHLNEMGASVVGLRLPGHGTAPSGLVEVHWQDMAAAVNLALNHLRKELGDSPIYIVGYSNGAALAVYHALKSQSDDSLVEVDGLILISPAIGVTKFAALAIWQARLGHLLGLDKLAWNAILPEYDPYKYGSFAINAGDQSYRISLAIQDQLDRLTTDQLQDLPPILAFQSIVDATVSVPAVVHGLFERLPKAGHELVLFDINHIYEIENLLKESPRAPINSLFDDSIKPYTFTLVTNERDDGNGVIAQIKSEGGSSWQVHPLDIDWPSGLYSLSHVAMPISEYDPLYGGPNAHKSPGIELGKLALRGERGVLQIGAEGMLRLRWNPFYPYLEQRVLDFMGLSFVSKTAVQEVMPVSRSVENKNTTSTSNDFTPCSNPRPEVCTQQYDPVCARHQNGVFQNYSNSCMACSQPEVQAYRAGACE